MVQCYINNTLRASATRSSSTTPYTLDITNYLSVGSNDILLTATVGDSVEELYSNINVVNLTLTSSFNENQLIQGKTFPFSYSFKGSVDKTVYFKIDNNEPTSVFYPANRSAEGAVVDLSTETLSHGIHKLTVWGEAVVGASTITTPELSYQIPVWKNVSDGTIIVINEFPEKISEGETVNIRYTPYHATETSMEITLSGPEDYGLLTQTFNATIGKERVWSFVAANPREESYVFNIQAADGGEATVNIIVEEGEFIDYTTDGILYSLDLIGRDNALSNRDVLNYRTFGYNTTEEETSAIVDGFNFATDGWLTDPDEGGRNILRLNATSKITYPNMNLFSLLENTSFGNTFEIDFKGRNTTTSNKTLVSLITGTLSNIGNGILINEQSVRVSLAGSDYEVQYKAGERVRISITISPNTDDRRLVIIYINGILSFVNEYTTTSFGGLKSSLVLNPINGFCDIYGLRIYRNELSMSQVLNNYIASYNSAVEKGQAKEWNDIYDDDGNISYTKVNALMPTFVFRTQAGVTDMPPAKGTKRKGNAYYIDPIYGNSFEELFSGKKPEADVQGTSSQKYPRKNYKIKFDKKHLLNLQIAEKVYTFKKDFMDSSHANNTGLAKLVQTLYFTPVPPQMSYLVWMDENEEEHDAYDINDTKVDYEYIYNFALTTDAPFLSIGEVNINPEIIVDEGKYYINYMRGTNSYTLCELKVGTNIPSSIRIEDCSNVRTTVYGQPCAFFWQPTDAEGNPQQEQYFGIYNFNTDKVATNSMKLEEEGVLSFEFCNNVADGVLFKSCENFTEVQNSFEFRAYEKDGISLGLLEDYYLDDKKADSGLVSWANGGIDDDEVIPILNALYNEEDIQLYTKIEDQLYPINYPFLTTHLTESGFYEVNPRTLEAQYRLNEGNIEAAFVASRGTSDMEKIASTLEDFVETYNETNGTSYSKYSEIYAGTSFNFIEAPTEEEAEAEKGDGAAIDVQIINQDVNYIVQWGYEEDGSVAEWHNYCLVSDLLTTIPEERQGHVYDTDVSVEIKSGTQTNARWNYTYPIEQVWYTVALKDNIYDKDGNPVNVLDLRKYDLYELMFTPVKDVVNWVIDCWNNYQLTKSTSKFTSELEQHLNKEYVIIYYVMGLFAGAADSFAKNMFWNSYDGGNIWYPVWYDIDTCFGLSNDGHPNFPYSLEIYGDGSKLGAADIYNGAKSNFWKLVYAAFSGEIKAMYNKLRPDRLNYDSVMHVLYDEQISLIAPVHYNEDAKISYLPYPSYYYTAQGRRYERLKWWIENRIYYLDSDFEYDTYTTDSFELRSNAGLPINVTTNADIYVGCKFGQHVTSMIKKRCLQGGTVSFDPIADGNVANVNDLETLIYGASRISSLGDLSQHQITSIKFPDTGKSVLEAIEIGKEEAGYVNNNFTTLSVGANDVLTKINVGNCINLGSESSVLNLSKCPSIQQVYAKNTKLTNIMLPEGSPIRILHLPYGTKNLELVHQIKLNDLEIESCNNIETLIWENTPNTNITVEEILNEIYSLNDRKLNTVRLIDYYPVESVTTGWMNWMMERGGINDIGGGITVPYITGRVAIKTTGIDSIDFKHYMQSLVNALGKQFVCASVTDQETLTTTYYSYDINTDSYEIVENKDLYKLELHLDQIVEDEYIFGVVGEGE